LAASVEGGYGKGGTPTMPLREKDLRLAAAHLKLVDEGLKVRHLVRLRVRVRLRLRLKLRLRLRLGLRGRVRVRVRVRIRAAPARARWRTG
jgi:hypothetical protein